MTANVGLVVFLIAFWGLLAVCGILSNLVSGKRWNERSQIYAILALAAIALIVGWLLNLFISPWGTWCIMGIHVLFFVVGVVGELRQRTPDSKASPQRKRRLGGRG
jgi:hypothetical protein